MKEHRAATLMVPLCILMAATALFRFTNLDLAISALFFSSSKGFYLSDRQPWKLLYEFGEIPGLLLGLGGLILFGTGIFLRRASRYRKIGLFLFLFLLVGPGFLVNGLMKEYWGRPRPCEIIQFNGAKNYLPILAKGTAHEGRSFPSGHAAIAYVLMAPFFFLANAGRRRHSLAVLGLGLAFGAFVGLARIVQGGHFASDVLWSAAVIYFTGLALSYLFR
ncbi:MAG: phosphatase PAP2 family protein, partial [Deltaproteobacteria bacterium]|nr:phosphatase PAP2 family protein [Deltaproteobacteria bacterium]